MSAVPLPNLNLNTNARSGSTGNTYNLGGTNVVGDFPFAPPSVFGGSKNNGAMVLFGAVAIAGFILLKKGKK